MSRQLQSLSIRIARFWKQVARAKDGCWLWQGTILHTGYGQVCFEGHAQSAHRVAWLLTNGEIPKGLCVCHRCDTRACVRPDHLFLGTAKDNMQDMYRKGRGPTGLRNGALTRPHRRAWGDRNGSRTHPESRPRGEKHYLKKDPMRVCGENNAHCILTDSQVAEIRRRYAANKETQQDLAADFGVSQAHISRLVRRQMRKIKTRRNK